MTAVDGASAWTMGVPPRVHLNQPGSTLRQEVSVGVVLAEGGTATIHALPERPGQVLKLYRPRMASDRVEAKVQAMASQPPDILTLAVDGSDHVQLAWPLALARSEQGFAGFVMAQLAPPQMQPLERLLSAKMRRAHHLPHGQRLRLYAAHNLARLVADLHRLGHHVIDLKPINVMVEPARGLVSLLDCDGFSILGADGTRYPASEYSEGLLAPEVGRQSPASLGEGQDRFALAVILFQLLNNGLHPFQGVPKPARSVLSTVQERINARQYAYGDDPAADQGHSPFSLHGGWRQETRVLFDRAFTALEPLNRPSAADWADHLAWLTAQVQPCPVNPDHVLFGGPCASCALERTQARQQQKAAPPPGQRGGAKGSQTATPRTGAEHPEARSSASTVPYILGGIAMLALAPVMFYLLRLLLVRPLALLIALNILVIVVCLALSRHLRWARLVIGTFSAMLVLLLTLLAMGG